MVPLPVLRRPPDLDLVDHASGGCGKAPKAFEDLIGAGIIVGARGYVLPDDLAAGSNNQRPAELHRILLHAAEPAAPPECPEGLENRARPDHLAEGPAFHARQPVALPLVVDEQKKGEFVVGLEGVRVRRRAHADEDDLGAGRLDLGSCVTQLRDVWPAENSPVVAQEDQRDRSISPEVAEPYACAVRVREN